MKIWILFLCVFVAGVSAQSDEDDVPDYWDGDYNEQWYQDQLEKLGLNNDDDKAPEDTNNFNDYDNIANVGNQEKKQDEMDKKVEEEIQEFQENFNENDAINDYQYEDNRSEQSEKVGDDEADDKAQPIRDDDDANNKNDEYDEYGLNVKDDVDLPPAQKDDEKDVEISKDDDVVPLPIPPQYSDEVKQIMEETKAILDEEEEKPNDFAEDDVKEDENIDDEIKNIFQETEKILEQTDNKFDEESDKSQQIDSPVKEEADFNIDDDAEKKIDENLNDNIVSEDEDTVDKVYEDLNDDLSSLFETLDKLTKSVNEDDKVEQDLVDYAVNSDESLDEAADYENVLDSNLSDLFSEHSKQLEEKVAEKSDINDEDDIETMPAEEPQEAINKIESVNTSNENEGEKELIKSVSVDDLTNDQLDQLMKDFEVQHSDAFDAVPNVDHFVNKIKLQYGKTKVITSENYPAGYPTNRIVDWIITGEGVGIEFNVTDFAVNSALGDYLMVKPGQTDDSGSEGLLFAYHLNEPRAYRFVDVDKLFLRFDSKNGFSFLRGFSITVKMIAPLPADPEPEPEPEPVLPEPRSVLHIMLGGLTLGEFKELQEDFRLLVADMATMYINANRINPGINRTSEITQIISASVCNVHWPGYEQCAHVKVSVPLVYEDGEEDEGRLNEEDLQTMWKTYVDQDPFAARLRQMGIEEFAVPNDGGVLTVWLVVALGVLVSAAMLAFALWRYSCFDNYSRMPAFSDVDSINEKRGLDLYPTPHQTLPPLYSESEYKWDQQDDSARVDMGGYANRSYTRTDIYELDSDEDIVVPRDRYTTDV
ncbi:uncharacterized protein isoform X2 [Choristoneura fumiferana]|uniref:uncharacterized protein isoform X2 n=1 Tax=Choristoneura fumiferana TaxID=7141 RepID=UPI003D15E4CD